MDGGTRMSSPSFDRRLSTVLAAAIVAVAVIAAFASFALSFHEAKEFQDDALQQVASMAPSRSKPEAQSQIMVLRSPPDALPGWLPARLEAGFHTLEAPDGKSMRVFVRDDQDARVVVMQDMQLIDDVAEGSAAQTFIPALLLIPLVAWLSLRVLAAERRRVQAERRFIANAAHELRSPLLKDWMRCGEGSTGPSVSPSRCWQWRGYTAVRTRQRTSMSGCWSGR